MKKLISVILAISLVFSLAACGAKSSPTDVVRKYCDAMKQLDTKTMSACLLNGSDDSDDSSLDEEYGDFSGLIEYFKECAAQQKYEILDSTTSNDKGTVTVKFTYVDATNVITETFQAYLLTAFGLALSNADEETMQKAFFDAFESKKEIIKTGISEVTVVFNCTKTDSGWLIDDSPEEIADVLSCNASKAFDGLQSAFDGSDQSASSSSGDGKVEVWHDIHPGETAELASLKVTVTSCEETKELKGDWSSIQADEGTKFVVFTVTLENKTKQAFTFNAYDMPLQDGQERQYRVYDNAWMYVNEAFFYTELAPNIKKTGSFVYQLPEDSTDYYFMCGKSGTNEGFRFWAN